MKARIRIHGFLIFSAVCLVLIFPKFILSTGGIESQDDLLDAFGVFFVFIGYILRISSRGYKIENSAVGGKLVQEGPYAFVRNPMYLGTFFIGSGIILVLFQPWLYFIFLIVFSSVFLREIKKEKAFLTEKFGERYVDYCRRVPALFPSLDKLFHVREYVFVKPDWVQRELVSFRPVMVMIFGFEAFHDFWQFRSFDIRREFLDAIIAFVIFFILLKIFTRK